MQKSVQFSTKFEVIKPLNDDFTLCKCRVMALGKNRNYSHFSKEAVDDALPTLANIPVIAHVYADTDGKLRLGGHDCEIVSEDGTYKFKPTTIPWGVVPESHNAHYEEVVEADGNKSTYLVADLILWNRFEDIFKTFYSDEVFANQSMEIDASDWDDLKSDTRYEDIKKFSFSALCLLNKGEDEEDPNNVAPCFPSSDVRPYKFEFDDKFNELTEQLKHELSMCFASMGTKGGNVMSKETIEAILKEFSVSEEQLDFEITENMTEDTLREKLASFADTDTKDTEDTGSASSGDGTDTPEPTDPQPEVPTEPTGDDGEEDEPSAPDDDEDEKPKKKKVHSFAATYNQKRDAIAKILEPVSTDSPEPYFWLMDFDETYAYVERSIYTDDGYERDYGRIKYAFDEKNLTAEKTGEFEKMIVKWLTIAENDEIEAKRAEYEELKAFKADCVDKEHRAECDEILAKFSDLEGNEEFAVLKEKAYEFEKDALERECFVIRGKSFVVKPAKQKNNFSIKIPIHTPSEKTEEQEFMERYSN